jgi:hypothetical protein
MAIIRKFSPKENLNFFNTFINDTNPNSTYFRISEFKEDFTGGKNGFTIEGSEFLKETTELKIEILDVNGNTIFFEPGDGIPEYYEGISKVVSVHVYDDTPIGIAEITILGELKDYIRTDGTVIEVPDEWKGVYNVKWKRTFKVNRLLPNEDKVRFYRRPKIQIDELAKPIFNTTSNLIIQNGTIIGIPNNPLAGTPIRNYSQPTSYRIDLTSGTDWSGSIVGSQLQIPSLNYFPTVIDIIDRDTLIVREPYTLNGIVQPFPSTPYTASFNETPTFIQNNLLTGSFSKIRVTDLKTFVGDVARVKVFRKSQSTAENFQLVQEIQLESNELLIDLDVSDKTEEFYGLLTEPILAEYWTTSSNNLQTSFTQQYLYNSVVLNGTSTPHSFYSDRELDVDEGVEYTLSFGVRLSGTPAASNYIQPFISGSRTVVVDGTPITTQVRQNITKIVGLSRYLEKNRINANFIAEDIDNPKLYFEVVGNGWYLNEISLTASQESSFSPDQITFVQVVPRNLPVETFDFRFEFYDINNNYIPVRVTAQKTFSAGNLQQLNRTFRITPTSLFFTFNPNGQSIGNNVITFNIEKAQLTGSVTFTSGAYDSGGLLIPSESYTGQYPGLLTNITETSAILTSANFTGSDANFDVSYIQYVAQCEDLQSTVIIGEVIDGESSKGVLVQADHNQFFYKRSTLAPTTPQTIAIRANKINIPPTSNFSIISSSNSPTVPPITLSAGSGTSTEIYTVDTNVFQYDDGPTEYEFNIEDEFGNPFTSSIVIESVVDGAAANLKLSRDNHTYVAKSTGELLSSITDGNVDIDLFVGSDQIDYVNENPITTNNRWSIIGVNAEGVTPTSVTIVDGNTARIGITSFDSNLIDSGSVFITASYRDGAGVSESISRKITYNKTKKAAPVLQLQITNNNQSTNAKSTGEQLTSFEPSSLSVVETYDGVTLIKSLNSTPTITATGGYTGFSATSNTITYANLSASLDTTEISVSGSVTDIEGSVRNVRGDVSLTKVRKTAPNVSVTANPPTQTVSAKSTGELTGTPQNVTILASDGTVSLTYNQGTLSPNQYKITNITTNGLTVSVSDNPTTSTIQITSVTADTATAIVSGSYMDSEGTVGNYEVGFDVTKAKSAVPTITVTANPTSPQQLNFDSSGNPKAPLTDVTFIAKEGETIISHTLTVIEVENLTPTPGIENNNSVAPKLDLSTSTLDSGEETGKVVIQSSYINSEGTNGTQDIIYEVKRMSDQAPVGGIVIEVNPQFQTITRTVFGQNVTNATPFTVRVREGSTFYGYSSGNNPLTGSDFKIINVISGSGISSNGPATSNTITPVQPSSIAGTTVSFDVVVSGSDGSSEFTEPRTHRVSITPEGQTGPGIVFTGVWETGRVYQFSAGVDSPGTARRDAVLWSTNGSAPYNSYYATLRQHLSDTTTTPTDNGAPNFTTGSAWQFLGTQDFFVAAKIGIFEESYVQNTLNIGTTTTGSYSSANITIAGGLNSPYISIGQYEGQDYGLRGIFIGSGSAAKLSLVNPTDTRALKWDGSDLSITGSLNITGNSAIGGILTVSQSNPGYANEGIFIGVSENKARLSLRSPAVDNRYNSLEWNGENLIIRGGIRQTSAGIVVTESIQRGTWTPNTEYNVGNIVQYAENGNPTSSYSATLTHISSNTPPYQSASNGKPGFGPWEIFAQSGQTSKVVQLSATSYVIAYNADNSNPTPSSITLIASSSNFTNGWFLFEGDGLNDTFEVGNANNNDSIQLNVASNFPNYFSTPKSYIVRVGEGNSTEITSDRITIYGVKPGLPGTPGDSSIEYKIIPKNGTQIKNSEGTLELQAVRISGSILTELSSGDYKLASGSTVGSILTVGTGITAGSNGVAYNPIIGREFISGSVTIYLITGSSVNEVTWDTITLVDVEDGLGGGSFLSSNLSMRRSDNTNTFTPSSIQATASFFSVRGTEYTSSFELFPSYSVSQDVDFMWYELGYSSPQISLKFDDGDGSVYTNPGQNNAKPTKDVVVTATFTDPFVGKKTTIQETYFIISDGIDGADAYTIVVPNNSHTFTTDSSGVVSDYTNSGTTISVLKGIDILQATTNTIPTVGQFSASIASSTNITPTSSFTVSGKDIVYGNHSNMTSADNASIIYTIFLEGTTLTVNTQQTFSKSKAGISGSAAKVVSLSATSFVVAYNQDGTNPTPTNITLIASSSNFTSPRFKFTGGGSNFTDETTYTVGTNNNDTASFNVPSAYFDTPLQFRVGVADGDQTEVASDTITITAIKPGSDSDPQYFLTPLDGTQIKNSNPNQTLRIQAQKSDPITGLTNLNSGDIKIYSGSLSGSQLASLTGFSNTTDYFVQVSASAIDGIKVFTLKSGSTTYDSITLLDVTDGLGGGSIIANSLVTTRLADNTFNINPLRVTASFFTVGENPTEYTASFRISASFVNGVDRMAVSAKTGSNFIVIVANDGDGVNIPLTNTSFPTKDVNIIATFTDPNIGQVTKVQETFYIVSDGKDGEDAITITNSNQAHVVPSTNSGIVTVADLVGSGTTIEVFEGINKLTRVTSNVINGQYTLTASVSPNGSITIGSISGGETVLVGNHTTMSQNVDSSVITYTINGKRADGNIFSSLTTQTLTKAKAGQTGSVGATGPGLVYRGIWSGSTAYSSSENRRDIVSGSNLNGNRYWIAKLNHISSDNTRPTGGIDYQSFWDPFGATFTSIATSFILTEDAVATRTISVGENSSISIVGGSGGENGTSTNNPYISIGQGNNQGYDKSGIFLGISGGTSTKGSGTGSLSISGSQGALKWNGASLSITGSLDVVGNSKVSGTITVGATTNVKIGPTAVAEDPVDPTNLSVTTITNLLRPISINQTVDSYEVPVTNEIQSNYSASISSNSSGRILKVSGIITPTIPSPNPIDELEGMDGFITVDLYNSSLGKSVAFTNIPYRVTYYPSLDVWAISDTGSYTLYHTVPNNTSQTYTLRTEITIRDAESLVSNPSSLTVENVGIVGNPTFSLFPIPNMAIRNTGIYVNYDKNVGEVSLLDLALSGGGGTIVVGGGGGGGGVTSITSGDGLSGGTIISTGTISLDTGSLHFISGSRKTISVVDTTGPSGINLEYNSGTGVLSGSLVTSSFTIGTTTLSLGETTSSISGLTSLTSINITGSNISASGTITGNTFSVNNLSTNDLTASGNVKLGDATSDSHTITGSLGLSGSMNVNGSSTFTTITTSGNVKLGDDISDSHTITGSLGVNGDVRILNTLWAISGSANTTPGQLGHRLGDSTDLTRGLSILDSKINITTPGQNSIYLTLGRTGSLNNQAEISFQYAGLNSDNNAMMLGLFGRTDIVKINGNRLVQISGSLDVSSSLTVNGNVNIAEKIIHLGDTDTFISFPSNDNISLQTNNTEKIRISSTATIVTGSLTLNRGDFQSPDYNSDGYAGRGFKLISGSASDPIGGSGLSGGYKLELDHLLVRGTMKIYELLINQIRATNGTLFVSSVGKVDGVEFLQNVGGVRYFELTFDTGSGGLLGHGFLVNDLIRAQRYTPNNGSSATVFQSDLLVYYLSPDGKKVRALTTLTGTKDPEVGYEYVRLGNVDTGSRQGTVYLTADDTNAPYINVIDGVNSHTNWNTLSTLKARMGKLNGITGTTFGNLSGYGFYASGSAYLEGGINATTGRIANWSIVNNSITSSNIHLSSSNGGVIRMGSTLPTSHTVGNGIFLSGSGQALIGNAAGSRIQFDGSNLILSSSTFLLGNTSNFISGSGGNIRISGSNVQIQTPTFLLGNTSNFISGSGGNIRISGSNVQVLTPSFLFGGSGQFISGSGGNLEISSSNFHLLNGNMTASNGSFSGRIIATTGSFTGNVTVGTTSTVKIGPDSTPDSISAPAASTRNGSFGLVEFTLGETPPLINDGTQFTNPTNGTNIFIQFNPSSPKASINFQQIGNNIVATVTKNQFISIEGSIIVRPSISTGLVPEPYTSVSISGEIEVALFNGSTLVASTKKGFSNLPNKTGTVQYELYYTEPNGGNITYSIRAKYTIFGGSVVRSGQMPTDNNINQFGFNGGTDINADFKLFPPPNMAITNTGIFVNYGNGVMSLLDLALAGGGGTVVVSGGGGGGTVTSITAGSGLLADNIAGGSITSTGTLSLATGSVHFTSGVKTYLNTQQVLSGSINTSKIITASPSQDIIAERILIGSGSNIATVSGFLRWVDGRVGIGDITGNPATALHIQQYSNDSNGGIRLSKNGSTANAWSQYVDGNNKYILNSGSVTLTFPSSSGTLVTDEKVITSDISTPVNIADRIVISTGNNTVGVRGDLIYDSNNARVGIATTPSARLHILQSVNDSTGGIRLSRAGSTANAWNQYVDVNNKYILTSGSGGSEVKLTFPSSSGTLALESQIPSTTNFVTTTNINQDIDGFKKFIRTLHAISGSSTVGGRLGHRLGDSNDTDKGLSILDSRISNEFPNNGIFLTLGKFNTGNNQAEISYQHVGNGNSGNAMFLGIQGNTNILKIFGSRVVHLSGSLLSNGSITAPSFTGSLSGNATTAISASTVSVTGTSINAGYNLAFVGGSSGHQILRTDVDTDFQYNPFRNRLFIGKSTVTGSIAFGTYDGGVQNTAYAILQPPLASNDTDYTITLPSSAGTLALVSQLPSTANFVTTENVNQTIQGNKTFSNTITGSISGTSTGVVRTVTGTNSAELVRGNMGDNDQARILVGATSTNAGFLEIATADDGTEPIYVRQYTGVFTTVARTATLLDGSGNTSFPGGVTATSFTGSLSGNATSATTATSATNVGITLNGDNNSQNIVFVNATSGNNGLRVDNAGLQYNPSTNTLFLGDFDQTTFGKMVFRSAVAGGPGTVTLRPPLVGTNYDITLPSSAGTLALTTGVGVTSLTMGTGISGSTNPITGSGTIGLTGQALSLHNLATNGFIYRSGSVVGTRTITAGDGISISNGAGFTGNPVITNTAPDQTVTISQAGATTVTGTYPHFTISSLNTTYTAGDGLSLSIGNQFSVNSTVVRTTGDQSISGNKTFNGRLHAISGSANTTPGQLGHRLGDSTDLLRGLSILDSRINITTPGQNSIYLTLGRVASDKNQAEISFQYAGLNSDNNAMWLGLFNRTDIVKIRGDRKVEVSGSLQVANSFVLPVGTNKWAT